MPADLAKHIERMVVKRDLIAAELDKSEKAVSLLEADQKALERATEVIQTVAKLTQQELEFHISELVTLALRSVFPLPYRMVVKFELRRSRSEADLLLEDPEGNVVSPMDSVGGGVVDVAAFALRVSLWSLQRPRPRPILILDEPFRFLSQDLQPKASQMLHEISRKLKMQFLIVTHEENLVEAADKIFRVEKHAWRQGSRVIEQGKG